MIKAVLDGDWFSGATWDGGIVPTSTDNVDLNGHNLTTTHTIYFNSLTNENGGHITWTASPENLIACQGGDITAVNNIFRWSVSGIYIYVNNVSSLTTYTLAQNRAEATTFYQTANNYTTASCNFFCHKLTTNENSVGCVFATAYNQDASGYMNFNFYGDIDHYGGLISIRNGGYNYSATMNCNMLAYVRPFNGGGFVGSYNGKLTYNGNIICHYENQTYGENFNITLFNGNITFYGNDIITLPPNYIGTISRYGGGNYSYNIPNNAIIDNFNDYGETTYASNLTGLNNFTLTGLLRYGTHTYYSSANSNTLMGYGTITTQNNGKIISASSNFLACKSYIIQNPETFSHICEDGNFVITPTSTPIVYPNENDVKKDVFYAYGTKRGTLEPVTVDATNTINVYPYKRRCN